MIAIGEDLILLGKERAARVDQIDTGQSVLLRDLLCSQVLLYGDRIISAALNRRVIGNDHAIRVADLADSGNDAGRRHFIVVQAISGKLPDFEKRSTPVDQGSHAVSGQ